MTTTQPEVDQSQQAELVRARRRSRVLTAVVVVLFVAVVALGAWVMYDLTTGSDTAVPGDIEQVIDDYRTAWMEADEETWRAVVTDDFNVTVDSYEVGASFQVLPETDFLDDAAEMVRRRGQLLPLDSVGDAIVFGDGPWTVAVVEYWNETFGDWDGISTYFIVDEDGTLKVSSVSRTLLYEQKRE
jgi:hypothetical protein